MEDRRKVRCDEMRKVCKDSATYGSACAMVYTRVSDAASLSDALVEGGRIREGNGGWKQVSAACDGDGWEQQHQIQSLFRQSKARLRTFSGRLYSVVGTAQQ